MSSTPSFFDISNFYSFFFSFGSSFFFSLSLYLELIENLQLCILAVWKMWNVFYRLTFGTLASLSIQFRPHKYRLDVLAVGCLLRYVRVPTTTIIISAHIYLSKIFCCAQFKRFFFFRRVFFSQMFFHSFQPRSFLFTPRFTYWICRWFIRMFILFFPWLLSVSHLHRNYFQRRV